MEDAKIIELYFARDERAISETDEKYGRYCFTVANNLLSDEGESEECVNDTYMRTWNTIPPTRPSVFRAFLAKIARNLALDRATARSAKKRNARLVESLDELSECVGDSGGFAELESREITAVINDFLKSEDSLARNIFLRRYFYLDSVSDIAKRYFIGVSRVKTTLFRMRERLAKRLLEEGVSL